MNASQEQTTQPLPVTVRFPPAGRREFYTGLTRNALNRMYKAGLLQTTLVNPGLQGRGYRVIFLKPLLDYLYENRQFEPGRPEMELPENPVVPRSRRSPLKRKKKS